MINENMPTIETLASMMATAEAAADSVLQDVRVMNFSQFKDNHVDEFNMSLTTTANMVVDMLTKELLDMAKAKDYLGRIATCRRMLDMASKQYYGLHAIC